MKRALHFGVFSLIVLLTCSGLFVWKQARVPGPLEHSVDHVVPKGRTTAIIDDLAAAGILPVGRANAWFFRYLAWVTSREGPIHAGELHFPAHLSQLGVLRVLRHASPVCHRVTIAEGLTAREITRVLEAEPSLSGAVPTFAEGSLLPQTLCFLRETQRATVVARLQELMRRRLREVWQARASNLPLERPEDLLIVASLVERETALARERPLVAEVFFNRLQKGMKLQSDPTVIYDLSNGLGVLHRPLTRKDLQTPGPHNTYFVRGLPKGPICSPGLGSLEAVAHPSHGGLLYFVADGIGGHIFSTTLGAHNHEIARLRAHK